MGDNSRFMKYVRMLPVPVDTVLSEGITFFITDQNPERVEFEAADNGYAIKVYTDRQNVEEAKEFWQNQVDPKLNMGEE
jgi:3-deoxy-D-manno-octulosonate 8-phosphate phosphatase KdsC-like HAD superfamily phosphatase